MLVFTFTASLFPLPYGPGFPTNKRPGAGDMARPPALVFVLSHNISGLNPSTIRQPLPRFTRNP